MPCYSKCGPRTSTRNISWALAPRADHQSSSQTYEVRICILTGSLSAIPVHLAFREAMLLRSAVQYILQCNAEFSYRHSKGKQTNKTTSKITRGGLLKHRWLSGHIWSCWFSRSVFIFLTNSQVTLLQLVPGPHYEICRLTWEIIRFWTKRRNIRRTQEYGRGKKIRTRRKSIDFLCRLVSGARIQLLSTARQIGIQVWPRVYSNK